MGQLTWRPSLPGFSEILLATLGQNCSLHYCILGWVPFRETGHGENGPTHARLVRKHTQEEEPWLDEEGGGGV